MLSLEDLNASAFRGMATLSTMLRHSSETGRFPISEIHPNHNAIRAIWMWESWGSTEADSQMSVERAVDYRYWAYPFYMRRAEKTVSSTVRFEVMKNTGEVDGHMPFDPKDQSRRSGYMVGYAEHYGSSLAILVMPVKLFAALSASNHRVTPKMLMQGLVGIDSRGREFALDEF